MKVYVASRFQRYERTREIIDHLAGLGFEITYDWTRTDEFGPDGHPAYAHTADESSPAPRLTAEQRGRYALRDAEGAAACDLFICFADGVLTGALIEFGIAWQAGAVCWILDPWKSSIFWDLPRVRVLSQADAAIAAALIADAEVIS